MVGDVLRRFKGALILQVRGDAGRAQIGDLSGISCLSQWLLISQLV